MIDFTSVDDELTLELPFIRHDGHSSILNISIDHFPYYLKTNDYTDFIRLALVQKEFKSLFNWHDLESSAKFQRLGDDESSFSLSSREQLLVSQQFVKYIIRNNN